MNLLGDGLILMVVGMGAVFVFLSIMVSWITLSAKMLARFEHVLPEAPVAKPAAKKAAPKATASDQGVLTAVIAAAIHKYRAERAS